MEKSNPDLQTYKISAIVVGFILMAFNACLPLFFDDTQGAGQIIFFLLVIGVNLSIVFRAFYDSLERDNRLSQSWILLFVLFGVLTLICYFFNSRGFKGGLITTGIFFLLWLASGIIAVITNIAVETIFLRQ